MLFPGFGPNQFIAFLLVFVRVLGIFSTAPVFGHAHLPVQLRAGMAFAISLVLAPVVPPPGLDVADNVLLLGAAAVREAAVGLVIGYIAMLVFLAIQLAGEVVDIQIGFGLASIADPLLGTQNSLVGQFQFMLATLLFLALNGHHFLLAGLARSFDLVPLNAAVFHSLMAGRLLDILRDLFLIGLRIGAPVMVSVFLADLALGLLGRTVPQMNLLMVGFPVKIAVGLGMLLVSLPFFVLLCTGLFDGMYRDVMLLVRAMAP